MWKAGQWAFYCDVCSRRLLSSEGKKRWDGLYVCPEDWETRHPLDFLKARREDITVPWSRPDDGAGRTSYTWTDEYLGKGYAGTATGVGDVQDGGDLSQTSPQANAPYIDIYMYDGYVKMDGFQQPYYVLVVINGIL